MKGNCVLVVLVAIVVGGCTGGEPEPLPPEMNRAQPSVTPTPTASQPTGQANEEVDPFAEQPSQSASAANNSGTTSSPAPAVSPVPASGSSATGGQAAPRQSEEDQWATEADMAGIREKAGVGMGRQGKGYGKDVVTYPLAAYFRMRERIFVDQVKHSMELYKATNGHYPRTQEEFRKEIIKASAMRMAVLPPGHKYYYDAASGELMVVQPQ